MSEAERQFLEGERADRSLFVQELLLSTLMHEESSSSDEDDRRDFGDFGAMGCVDIMPLDVALENLQLKESSSTGKEPPPPPLWCPSIKQTVSSVLQLSVMGSKQQQQQSPIPQPTPPPASPPLPPLRFSEFVFGDCNFRPVTTFVIL